MSQALNTDPQNALQQPNQQSHIKEESLRVLKLQFVRASHSQETFGAFHLKKPPASNPKYRDQIPTKGSYISKTLKNGSTQDSNTP